MDVRTMQDLSALVRGRRQTLGLTQRVVAGRANVSRAWLVDLEAGKATIEIGRVLAVLTVLGLRLTITSDDDPGPRARWSSLTAEGAAADDLDALLDAYDRGET